MNAKVLLLFLGIFLGALSTTLIPAGGWMMVAIAAVVTGGMGAMLYLRENEVPVGMRSRHRKSLDNVSSAMGETRWDKPIEIRRKN